MRISNGSSLSKILHAFAWSEARSKTKRYLEPVDFMERFWTTLSFSYATKNEKLVTPTVDPKLALRFGRLWDKVHSHMKLGKLGLAERALNTIIKLDEKNAAAFNRLGIIEAKRANFERSIAMFRKASKLEKSAAAFHNLALVHYETGNYKASEKYFRKAISIEGGMAARHVALAKVLEHRGSDLKMFKELNKAVELEPSRRVLKILYDAYQSRGMEHEANLVKKELNKKSASASKKIVSQKESIITEDSDSIGHLRLSYEAC